MPVLVVNRQTRWIWFHLFHLFHLWRYSPFQALASFIRRLHSSLFAALLLHPLIPTSFRASLWTTSAHLVLGLPTGQAYILLTERARIVVLQSCIMFENSMYQRSIPFPCSQVVVCLSIPSEAFLRFSEHSFFFFSGWGRHPHTQPPTWRTRVSLFVWAITFDLSGLGDPASNYTTAGLALRIVWPHKPYHFVKVETPSGVWFHPYVPNY